MEKLRNRRIPFIDVTRALGMFAIYVGHIQLTGGGSCFKFVWTFHVPLFFFISGCTEALNKESNIAPYIIKKIKNLIIPWIIFGCLSVLFYIFIVDINLSELWMWLGIMAQGCARNTFLNGTLWFLTCLFVVQLLFFALKKLKYGWLILAISFAMHLFVGKLGSDTGVLKFYNIDYALNYMIYYATGYIGFSWLNKYLYPNNRCEKIVGVAVGVAALYYTLMYYLGVNLIAPLYGIAYINKLLSIISVVIIIVAVTFIAKILEKSVFLQNLGRNSLFLCGSEYFVTSLMDVVLGMLGIEIVINNRLAGTIYAAIKLLIANYFFVPQFKKCMNAILAFPDYIGLRYNAD